MRCVTYEYTVKKSQQDTIRTLKAHGEHLYALNKGFQETLSQESELRAKQLHAYKYGSKDIEGSDEQFKTIIEKLTDTDKNICANAGSNAQIVSINNEILSTNYLEYARTIIITLLTILFQICIT